MNFELFVLGGHGHFVWLAFIFTFIVCFYLYAKTKRELLKQEKIFLSKFRQPQSIKIKASRIKEKTKEALSGSSI